MIVIEFYKNPHFIITRRIFGLVKVIYEDYTPYLKEFRGLK